MHVSELSLLKRLKSLGVFSIFGCMTDSTYNLKVNLERPKTIFLEQSFEL